MKHRPGENPVEPVAFAAEAMVHAALVRDHVEDRVRHFARLRAAHRALAPSSREPLGEADPKLIERIRACLVELKSRVDLTDPGVVVSRATLRELDDTLDAYQKGLIGWARDLPLAQLRASLATDTHAQRVEASALLHICLENEAVPRRLLHIVDFLITLLCAGRRDGAWVMDLDPADLNDVIRARCASGHIETSAESRITRRFQQAAEELATAADAALLVRDISAYKAEIAGFYFVPSVLRCVIGYNIAARNHFQSRLQRERALDAAIDDDFGLFAPLQGDDPRAAKTASEGGIPAHEAPGVIAVQEAIRRRLIEDVTVEGPAQRIASALDLSLLEDADREAFLDPEQGGAARAIRLSVVLGHLVTVHAEHGRELESLSLSDAQLDAWICELSESVQREVDTLIRGNRYDGAVRLGEIKSRFLAALKVVARRRLGRTVTSADEPALENEASDILRRLLEQDKLGREAPMFMDLLGGGWRRTVAFASVGLLLSFLVLGEILPSRDARRIGALDARQARAISPELASGYRDHAKTGSMFIGTLRNDWASLDSVARRQHAELIRDRVLDGGVAEVLLFDRDHVLQAHWVDGQWREHTWSS